MGEWKEYKLRDITSKITSGGTPKSSEANYYDGNIPWLNTKEVNFNRIARTEKCITEEGLNNSSAKWIPKGSVIIAMYGATAAKVAYSLIDLTTNQACCNLIIDIDIADSQFVYYYIQSSYEELLNLACGAAQQNLSVGVIADFPILLPPLAEQKHIASILTSLDDKIDLLHSENATLEAMAETLFRQWFIEEAKEDWKEISLTKVANFLNGLACQKYPPKNEIEKLPVLKIRELSNGIGDDSDWATTDITSEYIIHAGDVIFAWSASLMVKIWDGEDCILNQHLFKVTSYKYPKWFYYLWCKHHLNEFIAIAQSHATTMGHIKRSDLESAIVLIPSNKELMMMNEQMDGMLLKIENNNRQLQTLIKVRNGLLPKLINREISIYG